MRVLTEPRYIGDVIRGRYVRRFLQKGEGLTLDVGCGPNPRGDVNIDVENVGKFLKEHLNRSIGNFLVADACHLPFRSEAFSRVVMVDVLEHLEKDWLCLDEVCRVLKSRGRLLLHTPNRLQRHILCNPGEPKGHKRRGYTKDEMRLLLMGSRFFKVTFHETFNILETVAWELNYLIGHKLPLNLQKLLDFELSEFIHLGILAEVEK